MDASIWPAPLASFCDDVAGTNPAPAAVSASAVTAILGLSLLIKVLHITGQRKRFAGDLHRLNELMETAGRESANLKIAADQDIAAVRSYIGSHDPAAIRNAIEVPMSAARSAVSGLDLCADAASIISGLLAADLGAAALLLFAAVRAILISVDFNLRHLRSEKEYYAATTAERKQLEKRASGAGDLVACLLRGY